MSDQNNTPIVAKKVLPQLKRLAQFQTPDGTIFETQKEAAEHLRQHLVVDAVNAVAALFDGSVEVNGELQVQTLGEFLMANKAAVQAAFDAAKVERAPVSEATKALMAASRAMTPEQRAEAKQAKEDAKAQAKAEREAKAANTVA